MALSRPLDRGHSRRLDQVGSPILRRDARGTRRSRHSGQGQVEIAAPLVEVVDTVGAGDSFMSALLSAMDRDHSLGAEAPRPARSELERWLRFAATASAITCTRKGSIRRRGLKSRRPSADDPNEPGNLRAESTTLRASNERSKTPIEQHGNLRHGLERRSAWSAPAAAVVAASERLSPDDDDGDVDRPPDHRRRPFPRRPAARLVSHRRIGGRSDVRGLFRIRPKSFIGRLVLFGFTWALFHHLIGGIRHIVWDSGYGLDAPLRDQMAWATLIGGFALTIVVWGVGYVVR